MWIQSTSIKWQTSVKENFYPFLSWDGLSEFNSSFQTPFHTFDFSLMSRHEKIEAISGGILIIISVWDFPVGARRGASKENRNIVSWTNGHLY